MQLQNGSYRGGRCDEGSQGLRGVYGLEAEDELSEYLTSYLINCPEQKRSLRSARVTWLVGHTCTSAASCPPFSPYLRPEELR